MGAGLPRVASSEVRDDDVIPDSDRDVASSSDDQLLVEQCVASVDDGFSLSGVHHGVAVSLIAAAAAFA